MKKKILAVLMAVTMVVGLGGCGSSSSSKEAKQDEKVDSINIMVWDGTWSEEAIKDFEKETGIKVNVSYIDNTDTIISKLVQGDVDYDMIDIESAYVKSFVDNDLLTEIDHSKIENEKYLNDDMKGYTGDEDLKYTVPSLEGLYTCVIYNKETCPIEIKSFKDLTNPKLKNQICMVNSTISLFGMALQALGYKADSTSEKEISEAADLLTDIKANVKAFVGESAVSQLENGECSVAFCWDYVTICNDSKDNWDKFAIADIPTGNEYSSTYWGIPKGSTKVEAVEQFINFMLKPEELAKSYIENGGIPAEKEEYIKEFLPKDYYDNPAIPAFQKLYDSAWKIAVNDDQIALMDTYYTKLMGEN